MWQGDWAKGHAGGYGTDESDWRGQYDIWEHKQGMIAEKTEWTIDAGTNMGTIVYTIRQGVHWALNPISETSKKVGGREMTADDVAYYLTRVVTDPKSYLWRSNPALAQAVVTKTGPWEVSVTIPLDTMLTAIFRLGDVTKIGPIELKDNNLSKWQDNSFGTGPYMMTDYVPASSATLVKNPNYWETNPAGPGKGDQLPYIENVKVLIITDASTRQAALRTAKIDFATDMSAYEMDEANLMRQQCPQLMEIAAGEPTKPTLAPESIDFPADQIPFSDIRVRRALFMATDLKTINESMYGGQGVLESWPFQGVKGYEALRVSVTDPDCPDSIKELYTYNPEKAKQLLAEAGYPNGFKTKILMDVNGADYYSIIKDQWNKVGVDFELDVQETGAWNSLRNQGNYPVITDGGVASDSAFHTTPVLTGKPSNAANTCHIFDPKIDTALESIRMTILKSGMLAGLKEARELVKYAVDQAYAVPVPYVYKTNFWWPWVKNYTGERSVGYYNYPNFVPYIWVDQALKKEMGY